MFKQAAVFLLFGCLVIGVSGCGKDNIFGWAHQSGENSDQRALSSDAYVALQDKDFAKALEYYSKILESDPANAEAIYGYSIAKLAEAGIDIGTLVANLVKQQSAAPHRLAPAVAYAAKTTVSSNLLPSSILTDIAKKRAAVDDVLSSTKLLKILRGQGDGKIAPDNPDLNINVAFCLVLRAAMKVNDYITYGSDYETITVLDSTNLDSVARSSAKDLVSAYHRMQVVINKLNLGSDSAVTKINNDIVTLFTNLKTNLRNGYGIDFDAAPAVSLAVDYFLTEN
ncbi:MAG: hypothetical protein JW803_08910 [Endomicrobiales bacterium]|nr:hypothetical protein [Endomicrobiales bacterium]